MAEYTRAQIREARQTWIDFLQQPEREKAKSRLVKGGEQRCCLGHACHILDPHRLTGWADVSLSLPERMIERLGMWDDEGGSKDQAVFIRGSTKPFLSALNDNTDMTPQQIGALLATMIEGGADTPFKPLADYPEAL